MGKKSNWFVSLKKAISPKSEKKKRRTCKSRWMCRGKRRPGPDSSSSDDEPEIVASIFEPQQVRLTRIAAEPTIISKLPDSVSAEEVNIVEKRAPPIKDQSSSHTVHEHIKESVTEHIKESMTEHVNIKLRLARISMECIAESKLPDSVSAVDVEVVENVSTPIKEERSPYIIHGHMEESDNQTTSAPIKDVRIAETVSIPTAEKKLCETVVAPIKQERKLDGTVVARIEQEVEPVDTVLEPQSGEKFAEISPVLALPMEEEKFAGAGDEQSRHANSVAIATASAAGAAVAAAQEAAEVVRLATMAIPRVQGWSKEEFAAIKIQTVFRGYLARRALQDLGGLQRFKSLIEGNSVKHQATPTLQFMQTLSQAQSQTHSRRMKMSEENQALQRQLLLKCQKELANSRASVTIRDEWDNSIHSKEQIEANLIHKQEGVIRRERELAYAFSHQQQLRNPTKSPDPSLLDPTKDPSLLDPTNPQWGWSWLERWMAARPWENHSVTDHSDATSVRSAAQRELDGDKTSPRSVKPIRTSIGLSPSRPSKPSSFVTGKLMSQSPHTKDDSRSTLSMNSPPIRRRSISPSCMKDDECNSSSPWKPNYMQPTQSATAKFRLSPVMAKKHGTSSVRTSSNSTTK